MLRHVVMLQLSAEATDADIAAIVDGLAGLPAVIPEIRSYSIGRDAGLAETNYDLVVIGEFEDADGYNAYSANADHQAVITERLKPFLQSRTAVQYVID